MSGFQLAVTPEGTRKRVNDWKKGFYFIALKANVPIVVAYFDYKKKEAVMKGFFILQVMWIKISIDT